MIYYCQGCGNNDDIPTTAAWPQTCHVCQGTMWANVPPDHPTPAAVSLVCWCKCHRTVGQPLRAVALVNVMETAVACWSCYSRHRAAQVVR